VDAPACGRVLQGREYLSDDLRGSSRGHRTLGSDERGERLAADVLHHDEGLPFVLADRVDRDDVDVLELRRSARLAEKTLPRHFIAADRGPKHLARHVAVQRLVARLAYDAHPSPAADLDHIEVPQPRHETIVSRQRQAEALGKLHPTRLGLGMDRQRHASRLDFLDVLVERVGKGRFGAEPVGRRGQQGVQPPAASHTNV